MRQFNIKILLIILIAFFISGCGRPVTVSEDNLTAYDIVIPDIENEYSFLFLTDTHIIISDESSEKQILDYSNRRIEVFKDKDNPVTPPAFTQWVDYANEGDYDGLLLGGDIIDSPSSSNLKYLDSALSLLQIPYIYTLGNHDWTYPWEYMTEAGKNEYLPRLSPYMEGDTVLHSKEYPDFTIVSVDNSSNQINPLVLEKYKQILEKKKPVILMLHVPLYTESVLAKAQAVWKNGTVLGGGIHGGIHPDNISTKFLHLTTAKDSPVAAVLAGHVHLADKSDILGEKNIPQITGDAGFKGKGTVIHISGSASVLTHP